MVAARFGAAFAEAGARSIRALVGPVASAYGYHGTGHPACARPGTGFAEVAGRIAADLDAARRAGALDRIYAEVRDAYQVEIQRLRPAREPARPTCTVTPRRPSMSSPRTRCGTPSSGTARAHRLVARRVRRGAERSGGGAFRFAKGEAARSSLNNTGRRAAAGWTSRRPPSTPSGWASTG